MNFLTCNELFALGKSIVSVILHEFVYAFNIVYKSLIFWPQGVAMVVVMDLHISFMLDVLTCCLLHNLLCGEIESKLLKITEVNDMQVIQATNMVQISNVDNEKTIVHSIEGEEIFGVAQWRELCNFLGQQRIIIT